MMMNANLTFPSVKFQGVQIVMQSKSVDKRQEYDARAKKYLAEARENDIQAGLSSAQIDRPEAFAKGFFEGVISRKLTEEIQDKNKAFLAQKKLENANDPRYGGYRGILFDCGEIANPLRPDTTCAQSLYVDGEHVDRFAEAVGRSIFAPGRDLGGDDDAKSNVRMAGMVPTFTNVWGPMKVKWYQEAVAQYQAGQTDKILDLDA
jgi:hypothetical protein